MKRQHFHYSLPPSLIAHAPPAERHDSRLLTLDGPSGALKHRRITDLVELVQPGDLMVFNDTRVIPARLFGQKASGGKVEVLVERVTARDRVLAHIRASKSPKPGTTLELEGVGTVTMATRHGELFELVFAPAADETVIDLLERYGHMPLPPYIERSDTEADRERYQTVFARHPGAVAAPTAGLHFDDELLDRLRARGVEFAWVTLHVGAGTFQPVRADDIRDHHMHSEWLSVSSEVCRQVTETRARGGRVIAVGTTSVRCLETVASRAVGELGVDVDSVRAEDCAPAGSFGCAPAGSLGWGSEESLDWCSEESLDWGSEKSSGGDLHRLEPYEGETDIFIYPGYEFRVVDALVTNFHLPESTLLMLVSAFAGYGHIMAAYQAAVAAEYRFFSYGDAMFITRNPAAAEEAQQLDDHAREDRP